MLQSIKQLYGDKLRATDGEIGHVKDFYFDDQRWAIRYLLANTGTWLPGRKVLISPHAIGPFHESGKLLSVNLTRQQVSDSPSIEEHQPVSRQYEEEYYRYYGWPHYWLGDGIWGMSGFPIVTLPTTPFPSEAVITGDHGNKNDAHLRSTQSVGGYNLQASDGIIGHVSDFLMDTQTWAMPKLVIKTGHRLMGREVEISIKKIERISYEDSKVFVKMTGREVEQSPDHSPQLEAAMA
jgi:hypothetical protein